MKEQKPSKISHFLNQGVEHDGSTKQTGRVTAPGIRGDRPNAGLRCARCNQQQNAGHDLRRQA
jgi:hypothetical protein